MPCLLVSVILDIYMTYKVTPGKPCTHLTPRTVITTLGLYTPCSALHPGPFYNGQCVADTF